MDLLEQTQFYKNGIEYTRSNWREGSYFKSIIMTYYDSSYANYGIFAKPELHFNIFICDWFVKGKEFVAYNYYYYRPNKHLITENPETITRRYDIWQRIHLSEEPIIFTPDNIKCECGITHINNNKNLRIHINSKEHIAFCRSKYKYGVKHDKDDKEYIKLKNKMYYQSIKDTKPNKAKATLINYYKRKYGDDYIINLIEEIGVESTLLMVRNNKYNK